MWLFPIVFCIDLLSLCLSTSTPTLCVNTAAADSSHALVRLPLFPSLPTQSRFVGASGLALCRKRLLHILASCAAPFALPVSLLFPIVSFFLTLPRFPTRWCD